MATNAVALPPGFELQPQAPGMAGALPGEGAGPGREVAGSRVDPRQALRTPPQVPQATPRAAGTGMAAAGASAGPAAAAGGAPALPPGFQLEQPAAAPAPTPREVGFLETAGRTAAAAAIPIVRSIDMAAAGLAGWLAPLLGMNAEEEQAKVFRDAEARSARMRQEYEPQPGEQMSKPGQIAGGIASAPIEFAGLGVQHGGERAADVIQHGGTVNEARIAGGVSGAANALANALPVKAGGVVGRTIEGALGRTLGARVGQVAGGALTGGVLGAAGDVGVTEASNAALPEGDQFQELRQESDPATSFGLGAAFGGLGAHMERRGARKAAAAAGEVETPQPANAGATAPAGSVGAAGADVETARRERAAALPVPIELSKGEAMGPEGKFEQMQFERETAKQGDTGEPLRQAAAEKNERLQRNLDFWVDETGAESVMPRDVGASVDKALHNKLEARKAEIGKAYDAAREAGEMAEPVKTDELVDYLNKTGPESINAKVLQSVREKLVQLGGAKRDGEGGLVAGEIPINDLEEIRKMINRVAESAPDQHFGSIVKGKIDAITKDVGGELYREARRLRTNLGAEFNNRSVINDLVRNKRGTADRAVALEDVFDRSILRRSVDDVKHLRATLQTAGPEGVQAWRDLQGQTLAHIKDQATKNVARDIRGNAVVSASGLDKAIRALDDGRLELIFGKKGAEQLRDLNDVANNVLTSPSGTVNTSNTASSLRALVVNAIDTMVTFSASGVPVPALMIMKKALTTIRERGVRKRVAQALEQPAGIRSEPSGERPRFGEIDPDTGEVSPGAEVPREAQPATDPRLAEIERLRAATQNPEVHDVLDRRQRKVEAELAADREQAQRHQQAEELDAVARTSTDPEIRKALAARAEKLRGGAIPVGEAHEVPVEHVEAAPARAEPLPVGEATELPVERVEPAGQAERLPTGEATELAVEDVPPARQPKRGAGGSDPDADLTMLQPGAPPRGPKGPRYKRAGMDELLQAHGEQVISRMDAERRFNAGERIFVAHEMGETPREINSVTELDGFTPDQMLALPEAAGKAAGGAAYPRYKRAGMTDEAPAEVKPAGPPLRRAKGTDQSVSTRLPTAKKATEDAIKHQLVVGLESAKLDRRTFEHNVGLVTDYANYREAPSAKTPEQRAERFIEHVADNLLHLFEQVPPEIRERSKLWYDGARSIADRWQKRFDITGQQAAGVMAVLSPQKDWFMNVSMAERILDAMHARNDFKWDQKMVTTAGEILAKPQYQTDLRAIQGKTLKQVRAMGDPIRTAMWIRVFDQSHNPRTYRLVTPEGTFGEHVTNADGKTRGKLAWGSFNEMAKAVSIVDDGSIERISDSLGAAHKVRNFFNNIVNPNDDLGSVTIDTHAVAAGLLQPLSGASTEVTHNFGGTGSASNANTGNSGTYGLYAEAYRRAAKRAGVLPREMQSITWEAVRGLFTPSFKAQQKNVDAVRAVWDAYKAKRISLDDARQQINRLAGGVTSPDWVGSPSEAHAGARDSSYAPELSGVQLAGGNPPAVDRGARGATAARASGEAGQLKRAGAPAPSGLPKAPFKQRAELEKALRAKLGHKLIDGLLQRNVITMGDAPTDVPRDAQGRFTGSTVELFHNRLDAATAPGVLMHEVGAHYGMAKMLGEKRYAELLADLRKMRQRPEVSRIWDTVRRNYPDLPEGSEHFLEEVAAHLVESAPDRPIVRRILDAPRAYLYREFGVNVGRMDPDLVRALAVGALRESAGVQALSPNPTALATAGARQREDRNPEP